ncbi:MAG: serine/threonine protein kinase [Thermoguttaceae bacterium]|nr:serine/threonine protein kinase [Thermoguttaceae bacterium]
MSSFLAKILESENYRSPQLLAELLLQETEDPAERVRLAEEAIAAIYEKYYLYLLSLSPQERYYHFECLETFLKKYENALSKLRITLNTASLQKQLIECEIRNNPKKRSFVSVMEIAGEEFAHQLHAQYPDKFKFHDAPSVDVTEHYERGKYLAGGGQKDVYIVEQSSTGQQLALKELKPELSGFEECRNAMNREVHIQSSLRHQSVPVVFSLYKTEESSAFVEQLITGSAWDPSKYTLSQNLNYLLRMAQVIAFAHQNNVVHLDLKPENMAIDSRFGETYILDWGMALNLPLSKTDVPHGRGTLVYQPPEIANENWEFLGPTADVFCLGAILYELLTGKAPYEDAYRKTELLAKQAAQKCDFTPVPEFSPYLDQTVPKLLIQIQQKAMAKDPADRYANAEEFANALKQFLSLRSLIQSFHETEERFERFLKEFQGQNQYKLDWIAFIDEFKRLRRSFGEAESTENLQMFWEVCPLEFSARENFIRSALDGKDFKIAREQLDRTEKALEEWNERTLGNANAENAAFLQEKQQVLDALNDVYSREMKIWQKQRRAIRFLRYAGGLIFILVVILGGTAFQAYRSTFQALELQTELTDFEKNVLPNTLVRGYSDFLLKALSELDKKPTFTKFVITLPQDLSMVSAFKRKQAYQTKMETIGFTAKDENLAPPDAPRKLFVDYFINESTQQVIYFDTASTVASFEHAVNHRKAKDAAFSDAMADELFRKYITAFQTGLAQFYGEAAKQTEDPEKKELCLRIQKMFDDGTVCFCTDPEQIEDLIQAK